MKTISKETGIEAVIEEMKRLSSFAAEKFGHLTHNQVNWKYNSSKWSTGQVFRHIIKSNETYFPVINKIIDGKKEDKWLEKIPAVPGFFGKMMIKNLGPGSEKKYKSPKAFSISQSDVSGDIVNQFSNHQKELIELMRTTRSLDTENIIITSPASPLIVYSLADAFRIIVVHEQRHLKQAERILEMENFPKN